MKLIRLLALVAFCFALTPTPAIAVTGYDSAYNSESAFLTIDPGETKSFQVFFMNTGTVAWVKGTDSQVDLAACLEDKVTCNVQDAGEATWNSGWLSLGRYATTAQTIVPRGQIGAFAYNIKAPANALGTHRFNGDLVIAKTGDRIHPEGYYQDATVNAVGQTGPTPTPGSTPFPSAPPSTAPPAPPPTPGGDLSVTKADSPDPVMAGTNITYSISVDNAGLNSQGVTLTDAIPANTTFMAFVTPTGWTATTPAVGGTGNVTATRATMTADDPGEFILQVRVNPNAPSGTTITNTATIASTTVDPSSANNSATATTTTGTAADVSVTKTDTADPVSAGANLTYTLNLANNGPSDAQSVSLADVIPVGTTFVSFSQTSGPAFTRTTPPVGGTGTVSATAATFASGATAVFALVVNVNASVPDDSTITNTATVTSTTTDPTPFNNSDTESTGIGTSADLAVTKTDSPEPVAPDENITYTLTVSNAGPSDAHNVDLTDAIPANTTFVSFTAPAGWSTTNPAPGLTGTVSANKSAEAAGASAVFTLVVKVDASTPTDTTISNTASVDSDTADSNLANNSDTETTRVAVASADLTITKTDSPDPAAAGTMLLYFMSVTNAGPDDAESVVFTDTIPANTTFQTFAGPSGWTITTPPVGGTGTVTATRTTLSSSSASQVFVLGVHVSSAVPADTTISNTASVTSATSDPNSTNNSATEATTVSAAADMTVFKTDSSDPVASGADITYTITVQNQGPSDAQNVTLTDVIPANTTFVSLTSPAGWTTSTPAVGGVGTVTATKAAMGAGPTATFFLVVRANGPADTVISNTATVSSSTTDPNPANNSDTETTGTIGTLTVNGLAASPVCGLFTIAGSGLAPSTEYFLDFYTPAITPPDPDSGIPPTYDGSAQVTTDTAGTFSATFSTADLVNGTPYQSVVSTATSFDFKTNPVSFTVTCP